MSDRERIKGVIVDMLQSAMSDHGYGLFMSPSQIRAVTLVDVLIATGLADDDMVAERAAQDEAIRDMFTTTTRAASCHSTAMKESERR